MPELGPAPSTRFYVFVEHRYWVGAGQKVAVGPADVVRLHLGETRLKRAFGAYLSYSDGEGRSYLGVWGDSNVDRFLQVFSKLGVTVEVDEERPPKLDLRGRVS